MFNLLFLLFSLWFRQGSASQTKPPIQKCMSWNSWKGCNTRSLVASWGPWLLSSCPASTFPTRPSAVGSIQKMFTSGISPRQDFSCSLFLITNYISCSGPCFRWKTVLDPSISHASLPASSSHSVLTSPGMKRIWTPLFHSPCPPAVTGSLSGRGSRVLWTRCPGS